MKNALRQLSQKNISFNPLYRELTGSLAGGLLLSQLMYWFSKKDKFYKTDDEIRNETTLTKKELENAKKHIKNLSFVSVTREGIPAKTYYEIDWEKFVKVINKHNNPSPQNDETTLHKRGNTVSPKGGNTTPQKGEANIVNLLTDTTQKIQQKEHARDKEPITPAKIIGFYKQNISSLQDKVKELKSYNLLALYGDELEEIYKGLENYKKALDRGLIESRYVKSLKNFIEDRAYKDLQDYKAYEESQSLQSKKRKLRPGEIFRQKQKPDGEVPKGHTLRAITDEMGHLEYWQVIKHEGGLI